MKKFGTFEGVFTPAILTILGVIMYLRLGWVVGSVGLFSALVIILLAHAVTLSTGLSLASLATNTRVGAGGFYAFVSRSLGAEVGGAIGIPLYISQTLSISLYIIGFTEAWMMLFPDHNYRVVLVAVLLVLLFLSYLGAGLAMKIQYVIMLLIALSLLSFYSSPQAFSRPLSFSLSLEGESFWSVFAVFFPAVTGIGSGVALSGELKDPKKNLPKGILLAVACGFVIYVSMTFWYAQMADTDDLMNNSFVVMGVARWGYLVMPGIMGATLSSALGSLVGAPRILQALASDHVIPRASYFARVSQNGSPRNATLLTGVIVLVSFFIGDLDSIASLLTMFFLISYAVINATVFIEKVIRIPSFRPTFKIPIWVPLVGTVWCLVVMFLINSVFAAVSCLVIVTLYFSYVKRGINAPFGDVRSGIFIAIAEWAAKTSMRLPQHEKTWKPNLVVPVKDALAWKKNIDFVKAIVRPGGSVRLVTVNLITTSIEKRIPALIQKIFKLGEPDEGAPPVHSVCYLEDQQGLSLIEDEFKQDGLFVTATVVDSMSFLDGLSVVIQTMKGIFFAPNIMFLTMSEDPGRDHQLMEILAIALRDNLGIILLKAYDGLTVGNRRYVNIWLRTGSPNKNLAILTALQLEKNWSCFLRVLTAVDDSSLEASAYDELKEVVDLGRLNVRTEIHVFTLPFMDAIEKSPAADLNIFGINEHVKPDFIRKTSDAVKTGALFIMDSGNERMDV